MIELLWKPLLFLQRGSILMALWLRCDWVTLCRLPVSPSSHCPQQHVNCCVSFPLDSPKTDLILDLSNGMCGGGATVFFLLFYNRNCVSTLSLHILYQTLHLLYYSCYSHCYSNWFQECKLHCYSSIQPEIMK